MTKIRVSRLVLGLLMRFLKAVRKEKVCYFDYLLYSYHYIIVFSKVDLLTN
jgi:hypothetical protein